MIEGCGTCPDIETEGECPESKRECGHHCNCVWTHSTCDWCGITFCGECEGTHYDGEVCGQ